MKKALFATCILGLALLVMPKTVWGKTLTEDEVKEICKKFPFSSDAKPLYGCRVAAALDMSMPGTVNGVAKRYWSWGGRQREYYTTKRLPQITRWYTYAAYYWNGADKVAMFRSKDTGYWDNDKLATFLQEPATRLDVVRAMRPSGRSSSRVSRKPAKKPTRLVAMSKKKCRRCPAP